MAIPTKIKTYLDKERAGFEHLEHSPLFEASKIADEHHLPGKKMIKSVIAHVDGRFVMCLLPAIYRLNLEKLKKALHAKNIRMANEEEMKKLFPDCEVGSEPPFGELYGLTVYADPILQEDDEVAFTAGSHKDLLKMRFEEFKRLARLEFIEMGVHI